MTANYLRVVLPFVFAAVSGCKLNAPMVKNHKWSYQTKVQAVAHWKELAVRLADDLERRDAFRDRIFYVEVLGDGTEFLGAYGKCVVSALTERGFRVSQNMDDADLKLVLASQLVLHGRRFGCTANATSLAGGVTLGLRNSVTGDSSGSAGQTRGELLVTAWVHREKQVPYCKNQIVYVSAKDASLYLSAAEWEQFQEKEKAGNRVFSWLFDSFSDDYRW